MANQTSFQPVRQILVVEDEEINREILKEMLQDGFDVVLAENGREALECISSRSEMLSLILLDLNLPDSSGLDILRQIKADERVSRIPVIVVTSETAAEVESLTLGAVDFIPKPYPMPDVVKARVQRIIELYEDRKTISETARDKLTGLYNKEYFYRYAHDYDVYNKDQSMDAIVVNVNHFHLLNERYGKAYGDEVLRTISSTIKDILDSTGGFVCRREGDTFLVYMPHQTNVAGILDTVSQAVDSRVRLRMGVYENVDKTIDFDRRFDRAKMAADKVRNSFSRVIGYYDKKLHETEIRSEQLLEDFPKALEERQFRVFFQPKFNIRPENPILSSAEALARWQHPTLGLLSPSSFIPLFESNGLIRQLDRYIWKETARQIQEWKQKLGVSVPVSVNVSRVDMFDGNLVQEMKDLIQAHGLTPADLLLEITESAYTEDSEKIIKVVNELRTAGFCIEMDDFGSGYSSLNMISTLPVDALKLDMAFIRNAFRGRKNTRMLEFVFDMADSLEVPTIAEGVETAEQMLNLKAMGCDIVQGFYFSKPVPPEEFEKYLLEMKNTPISEIDQEDLLDERQSRGPSIGTSYAYDALHDPQTGLYNSSAYEVFMRDADQNHIALLIMQIENHEEVLQADGQKAADTMVENVAEALRRTFRSVDYICRLSQDEFAVILTRVNLENKSLLTDKMDQMNHMLAELMQEQPIILNMGAAFADRENPQGDIFQDADTALKRQKENGNGGLMIY